VKANRDSVTTPIPAWLRPNSEGFTVEVHVQPGARRSEIVGMHGGRLKLAVRAAPTEGQANDAVMQLIAERLACRVSAVRIAAGKGSRDKRLQVDTVLHTADEMVSKLQPK
jgi:uncharacterized protein (TIGR00251 family)